LLSIAKEILAKYDYTLPIPSDQKYNAYPKGIGDICKIKKRLYSHDGSHSFATLSLNKGVSLKAVSSMLGHTNIKQTKHCSKLMDYTTYSEMSNLENLLN
jgi:site-specific recombinase XerD